MRPETSAWLMAHCEIYVQDGSKPGGDQGVAVVDAATTAYLDLAGVLDPAKEAAKLQKQEKEVRASEPQFLNPLPMHCQPCFFLLRSST